jgi:hypothetical protein
MAQEPGSMVPKDYEKNLAFSIRILTRSAITPLRGQIQPMQAIS